MAEKRVRRSSSIIQDVELEVLKENLRNKHKQIVEEVDEKIDRIFEEFFCEVNKLSLNRFDVEKLFSDGQKSQQKSKPKKQTKRITKNDNHLPDKLPEKQFQPRNSLLTDLFEIKHVKTIYHVFIVIFNLLLLNVFVSDFVDTGKINIGLDPIITGFGGFHYAIFVWCWMQLTIFALFPLFTTWAGINKKYFSRRGFFTSVWNFLGVLSVMAYMFGFIAIYTRAVVHFQLGQASSVAVLMELVRFVMKAYAFIRTNVPRALKLGRKRKASEENSSSDDSSYDPTLPPSGSPKVNDKQPLPLFRQYAYFLFAPTLIYRDEYPRNRLIRWTFVGKCFLEVASIIFVMSFISERFMYPLFHAFGSQFFEIGAKELMGWVFNSMLPGLLCFLIGFYLVRRIFFV
jgi:sterol O-acyltransferase